MPETVQAAEADFLLISKSISQIPTYKFGHIVRLIDFERAVDKVN